MAVSLIRPQIMDTENKNSGGIRPWLPLLSLACAVFAFNSSELMPIGLLIDIAKDFEIPVAKAGLLITFYAWVVALMSLPLMVLCSRMAYRKLLLGVLLLFAVSHVGSALSTQYWMLMASRIGVACAHSVFWAIAPPMAVKIVPEGKRALALSVVAASTSTALICGLPLGRAVGLLLGWRWTFGIVAVLAFLIFAFQLRVMPNVPNTSYIAPQKIPGVLKQPVLIATFAVTALTVTAQFCGYSYVEPFLKIKAGMPDSMVTWVLVLYGVAGILSSILYTKLYDKHHKPFLYFAVCGIGAALFMLYPASWFIPATIAVCAFWGIAIMTFNLVLQSLVIEVAPPAAVTIAMATYSGIYNLGIGSGAFIGGLVEGSIGVQFTTLAGFLVSLVAAAVFFKKLLPNVMGLLKKEA